MLFYILSYLASILRGLTRYSISYHALPVSSEAWHAILYLNNLITPCQYPPRLGMLFYILSRLDSIRRGLACYSTSYHALTVSAEVISYQTYHALAVPAEVISYHDLAVSAEAWHAILHLNLSNESSSLRNSDIQACGSERYLLTC